MVGYASLVKYQKQFYFLSNPFQLMIWSLIKTLFYFGIILITDCGLIYIISTQYKIYKITDKDPTKQTMYYNSSSIIVVETR